MFIITMIFVEFLESLYPKTVVLLKGIFCNGLQYVDIANM